MYRFAFVHVLHLSFLLSCFCRSDFNKDGVQPKLNIFHHSCALKKDEGPCKATKERFYFNTDTHRCERFEYGGCQGNANNFGTFAECEDMCIPRPDKNPCHLEEEVGPCRGLVKRYVFNRKSQRCEAFLYGGCYGNANNFRTLQECHAKCHNLEGGKEIASGGVNTSKPVKPSTGPLTVNTDDVTVKNMSHAEPLLYSPADSLLPDFCFDRVDRGTCGDIVQRYMYNSKVKRCQKFRYSGCGGNKNNFVTRRQCLKMCKPSVLASLSVDGYGERRQIRIKKKNISILS